MSTTVREGDSLPPKLYYIVSSKGKNEYPARSDTIPISFPIRPGGKDRKIPINRCQKRQDTFTLWSRQNLQKG